MDEVETPRDPAPPQKRSFFDRPDLVKEVHLRIPLPIVVPIVALVALGLVAVGFSRLLLGASREAAIAIAVVAAVSILGSATFIAARPRLDRVAWAELVAIIVGPVFVAAGIAWAASRPVDASVPSTGHTEEVVEVEPIEVVADNLVFDTDEITLAAESEVVISFDNQDAAPHNIAIYPDEESGRVQESALFDGIDVQPGGSTTYEFEAPPAGTYYFQCDIHPGMNGSVVVE